MTRFLKEPLVHFIVAACLVFAIYSFASDRKAAAADTIFVSTSDMERMAALFTAEAGTAPSPDDLRAMVVDHVRQEALAREARRLGLDQGDTVVERRLAQKMTFMVSDLTDETPATEAELRDWYEVKADAFRLPARMTFQHVYFAASQDEQVARALHRLNTEPGIDWRTFGDPFILQRQFGDVPERELVRQFGPQFTQEVQALNVEDAWQGPVQSAYGQHIVRVTAKAPAMMPAFEAVRGTVEASWRDANARQQNADAIAEIIAKYNVEIEGVDD